MGKRFHINLEGEAGICQANKGNCPYGDDDSHFSSIEEAEVVSLGLPTERFREMEPQEAFFETMKDTHGILSESSELNSEDDELTLDDLGFNMLTDDSMERPLANSRGFTYIKFDRNEDSIYVEERELSSSKFSERDMVISSSVDNDIETHRAILNKMVSESDENVDFSKYDKLSADEVLSAQGFEEIRSSGEGHPRVIYKKTGTNNSITVIFNRKTNSHRVFSENLSSSSFTDVSNSRPNDPELQYALVRKMTELNSQTKSTHADTLKHKFNGTVEHEKNRLAHWKYGNKSEAIRDMSYRDLKIAKSQLSGLARDEISDELADKDAWVKAIDEEISWRDEIDKRQY